MSENAPCKWSGVEVMLKASLSAKEAPLLHRWRDGYRFSFGPCYPRLHVVTDSDRISAARAVFLDGNAPVPNVSFLPNNLAPAIQDARHPSARNNVYYIIQWHAMWVDNFTTAEWILVFDVDSVPILPFRCHQLFDERGRAKWHSWLWHHSAPWTRPCTSVFFKARGRGETFLNRLSTLTRGRASVAKADQAEALYARNLTLAMHTYRGSVPFPPIDLMTLFPIVIPRVVLPTVRELVTLSTGATHFDAAFAALGWPSHGDLIGKTALLRFPHLINLMHCPSENRQREELEGPGTDGKQVAAGANTTAQFECRRLVFNTEHTRHPVQGAEAKSSNSYLTPHPAAARADRLFKLTREFIRNERPALPSELFQYKTVSEADRAEASRIALRDDPPGAVCGRPLPR
jgi:hypothetical protein